MTKPHNRTSQSARGWAEIEAMSLDELRQEMAEGGRDPDAFLASMRKIAREARSKFAGKIDREEAFALGASAAYPAYVDAVAAGMPLCAETSGAAPEMLSLVDILRAGSAEEMIWARVSGWSMRDEGIKDGDLILVNVKREAKDGDLVLAHLLGRGELVKRLRLVAGRAVLASANPDFADIVVDDPATLRIQGVVMGRAGTI